MKSYTSRMRRWALALAIVTSPAAWAGDGVATVREEFRQALTAVESGAAPAPESEALRAYPLYPYLQATRLQRALAAAPDEALDAQIAALIKSSPDIPIVRTLRGDWLASLATREQWNLLLGNVDDSDADPSLTCSRFSAWIATGGREGLRDEVFKVWMTGGQLPASCVAPFEWLRTQGALTPEAHLARAKLALAAGNTELAAWLLRAAPADQVAPLQTWLRLQQAPQNQIVALLADRDTPVDAAALLEVWMKFARNNPDAARPLLPRLADSHRLDTAQLGVARRAVAMGYSWNRAPETVAAFRDVPETALDDAAHEWRVRGALWAGDWAQAAEWLHRMPPALAADPRWAYWRARSLEQVSSPQSKAIYETLAQANGYYAMLSAWRLKQKFRPTSQPLPADAALTADLVAQPGIVRAHELFVVERIDWASAEWRAALRDASDARKVQAARLAASWGWYSGAVPTLSGLNLPDDLDLLYPDVFRDEMSVAARNTGVPAPWLYGVMRQESLFLPRAVSSSNAYGLLQLLLPTAQHVARQQKWTPPTREDLMNPSTNIAYGATYLHDLLERFDGTLPLALAGYNAGPNAAARWIPEKSMDVDVWVENIPINQTRGYVAKILWNILVRGWKLTGEPQDPAPILAPVKPRTEIAG